MLGHIVEVLAESATIGRCTTCGELVLAADAERFASKVARHQASEAAAELEACRHRHPSSRPLEPQSTPWLNRSHG